MTNPANIYILYGSKIVLRKNILMKNKGDKTMKKVLLTSAVALAAFGAVQAVSADTQVLKPGMVDPTTGKLVTDTGSQNGQNTATDKEIFVDGKLVTDNNGKVVTTLPGYTRFGNFNITTASVTPVTKVKDKGEHYVRVNVVDAKGNPIPGVAIDFAVTTNEGVAYVTVTTDEAGSAIVTKTAKVPVDAAGTEVDAELPVSFAEGTVVKYRLVKSHASDGKDVEFVGEFKVSGDLYTNANIVINEVRHTDVTFQGQSATGWRKDAKGQWSYLKDAQGTKATGWVKDNGAWYYLNAEGVMQTGWVKDNGIWYYLDGSGAMQTGWKYVGGQWYYLDGSGAMQTGWKYVGSHWYYLNASGALLVNTTTPDGYTVNGNGELV